MIPQLQVWFVYRRFLSFKCAGGRRAPGWGKKGGRPRKLIDGLGDFDCDRFLLGGSKRNEEEEEEEEDD